MKSVIIFLFLLPTALTLDLIDINFGIDYFRNREVNFICLLTCEDKSNKWSYTFTRNAMKYSMRVSQVPLMDMKQFGNEIDICFTQKLLIGVLIDASCPMYEDVMMHASENTFFSGIRKWLIISKDNITEYNNASIYNTNVSEIDVFRQMNISVDADIVLTSQESRYQYVLYDVYNFGKIQGGDLIMEKLCVWRYKEGLSKNISGYIYYRRWDFKKWGMRMTLVSRPPTVFKPELLTNAKSTPGITAFTQTSSMILHVIAEIHNIRFVYNIADIWIEAIHRNNTEKVVIAGLYFKTQDITPVLRFLENVYGKIEIVQPHASYTESKYYYKIPTNGIGKYENEFLRPLSRGTWICIVATAVLSAIVLLLSARLEHRTSFGEFAVFSVLASICLQFFEDKYVAVRVSSARRLTVLVTGVFCVLIYNYYTSSVVSWLLSAAPPTINSLEELLDSPLELIYEDIGYTRSWLQSPAYHYNTRYVKVEDELRKKKVLNRKKNTPLFKSLEDGIAMVKDGGYAYHSEPDHVNQIISRIFTPRELCELGSVQSMPRSDLYISIQKNSPYREFLTWSLMRLAERGIMNCIQRRRDAIQVKCEGSSPRALALGGAAPAFVLLAAGYVLALLIMVIERFTKKRVFLH